MISWMITWMKIKSRRWNQNGQRLEKTIFPMRKTTSEKPNCLNVLKNVNKRHILSFPLLALLISCIAEWFHNQKFVLLLDGTHQWRGRDLLVGSSSFWWPGIERKCMDQKFILDKNLRLWLGSFGRTLWYRFLHVICRKLCRSWRFMSLEAAGFCSLSWTVRSIHWLNLTITKVFSVLIYFTLWFCLSIDHACTWKCQFAVCTYFSCVLNIF